MYLLTDSEATRGMTALPRTLFIALAARAQGAQSFPMLDPHDIHAAGLLHASGAEVQTSPADQPTVVNVLWRTQLIKQLGQDFLSTIRTARASIWAPVWRIISNGSTTAATAGSMWICPK